MTHHLKIVILFIKNKINLFLVNSRKQQEREAKIKEEIDRLKRQKRQDNLADFDPSRLYQRYEGYFDPVFEGS